MKAVTNSLRKRHRFFMHFVLLNIGWENQTVVSERFEPGKYYIYLFFTLKDSSLFSVNLGSAGCFRI